MADLHHHPEPEHEDNPFHRSFLGRLRSYFLAGILVTAPIAITIYLTLIFLQFIDRRVVSLIPEPYHPSNYLPVSVPGLGLLLAVVFFILIGWFTKNFVGRLLVDFSDYIVDRVPVIGTIYAGIKQIFQTVMATKSTAFREVVLVQYPRAGVWSMGFVTGKAEGQFAAIKSDDDIIHVYLPTALNLMSGFLIFAPRRELTYIDIAVEDAIKLVVSGGIIKPPGPQEMEKRQKRLTPKLAKKPEARKTEGAKPKKRPVK